MLRKSHYRKVAGESGARMLGFMHGSRYFRFGALAASILIVMDLRAQDPESKRPAPPVHSLSPEIVKAVREKLPKYAPPAPETPPAQGGKDTGDSPDVLHLAKITVRAAAGMAPTDFAMLTPKARMEMALKANPGIRIGNFFGSNNGYAAAMLAESREVARKAAVADTVASTKSDDGPESRRVERLLKEALARPSMYWAGDKGP